MEESLVEKLKRVGELIKTKKTAAMIKRVTDNMKYGPSMRYGPRKTTQMSADMLKQIDDILNNEIRG